MSILEQFRKKNSPLGNVSALNPYTDNILALKKRATVTRRFGSI